MSGILKDLRHRGPEQSGLYETPYASLGAVRLRILDLDGGAQPMIFEQPKTVLVFNGEIYNHAELRVELEQRGHRFLSNCDTETVLHAFVEWRTDCFRRLNGMFALAIWQEDERRLFLARDRIGIKPLYFSQVQSDLYFGSELKALFGHKEIARRVHGGALQDFLSLNYVPGKRTMVEGIEKLPPGAWLEWRGGELRIEQFWRLESYPERRCTLPEAAEELDRLLQVSVGQHLMGDVPLGVWASGGLDSSTVLHYAAEASSRKLRTFSVTFTGRSFDEAGDARLLAERYGTEHREFDVNPSLDLAEAVEKIAYYSDEPNADAGAVPLWFLSKMTGSWVKVALTGDGADELFAGYQTYRADALKRRLRRTPNFLIDAGRQAARLLPVNDEKIGFVYKAERFLAGLGLPASQAHFYWNGTFSENEKATLYNYYEPHGADPFWGTRGWRCGQTDWLQRALLADQQFYLADNILAKCDRMSMAHSVELRPPFLDHRIIEFANALPAEMKLQGGVTKVILRHVLKGKLPAALLRKKKEGLDIPVHNWLRTALKPLLLDTLSSQAIRKAGLFNQDFVQRLIEDHMAYRKNVGYHLWGLLMLALWMKRWGVVCDFDAAHHVQHASVMSGQVAESMVGRY